MTYYIFKLSQTLSFLVDTRLYNTKYCIPLADIQHTRIHTFSCISYVCACACPHLSIQFEYCTFSLSNWIHVANDSVWKEKIRWWHAIPLLRYANLILLLSMRRSLSHLPSAISLFLCHYLSLSLVPVRMLPSSRVRMKKKQKEYLLPDDWLVHFTYSFITRKGTYLLYLDNDLYRFEYFVVVIVAMLFILLLPL